MNINIGDKVFSHWTVDEKLGAGAYGTVYKLKRVEFGETYYSALKVIQIPPDNAYISSLQSEGMTNKDISTYLEDIAKSFMNEIKLLEELKGNTNIVSYEDHVIQTDEAGLKYTIMIRMELLTPLKNKIIENTLNEEEIAKIGIDICNALALCENKNIIHRDIKPDNIFVSSTGAYKLGDFGVARTMEKTVSAMSQKGTYTYMAPEVYLGREYDKTVDLYSLGILLYQLLNKNRTPFLPAAPAPIKYSDREEAQKRRMSGEQVPNIPDIRDSWNRFFSKALSPNAAARFQNADEMKNALNVLLNNAGFSDKNVVLQHNDAKEIDKDNTKTTGPSFAYAEQKQSTENKAKSTTKKSSANKIVRILPHILFTLAVVLSGAYFAEYAWQYFSTPVVLVCRIAFIIVAILLLINKFKKFILQKVVPMLLTYCIFLAAVSLAIIPFVEDLYWTMYFNINYKCDYTVLGLLCALAVFAAGILNTVIYSKKNKGVNINE